MPLKTIYEALFAAGADVNDVDSDGDCFLMTLYQKGNGNYADWHWVSFEKALKGWL